MSLTALPAWKLAIGGFTLAALADWILRLRRAVGPGGHPFPLPMQQGVPWARGPMRPAWPVGPNSKNPRRNEVAYKDVEGKSHGRGARRFKASRGSGSRNHAGIDLFADAGDVLLATEDGRIIAQQNFLGSIPGKDAIVVAGKSGTVLLYGEIKPKSYEEFGLAIGSSVKRGQPIARVGLTVNGSHMLHFETYTRGTRRNSKWPRSKEPPPTLLDPTAYLLRARATVAAPAVA